MCFLGNSPLQELVSESLLRLWIVKNKGSHVLFYVTRWPQFAFPPFKILQGTCLHKVRTGEQVCLVRFVLKNIYIKFCRVIGELDIKLDLVPPSLMNFIARQIVGKGFKLYKKVRKT